jgi:hypothetical protein
LSKAKLNLNVFTFDITESTQTTAEGFNSGGLHGICRCQSEVPDTSNPLSARGEGPNPNESNELATPHALSENVFFGPRE